MTESRSIAVPPLAHFSASTSAQPTFGFKSFSSSFFLVVTGLGGAAASLSLFAFSFSRSLLRFFNSVLDTFSPVISSRMRFATPSVGGTGSVLMDAMLSLCVVGKKGVGGGCFESSNFGNSWWGESRVTHSYLNCLSLPRDGEGECIGVRGKCETNIRSDCRSLVNTG